MMPTFQPPRRAVRLLEWALPEDAREHVTGDLQELYQRQFMAHGEARAHRWYWGRRCRSRRTSRGNDCARRGLPHARDRRGPATDPR